MRGYPRQLGLKEAADVAEVARAVTAEQRRAARCVRLRATDVRDCGDGLYRISVSGFPSLDWTWELSATASDPSNDTDSVGNTPRSSESASFSASTMSRPGPFTRGSIADT